MASYSTKVFKVLIAEAGAIVLLAGAAYVMSAKEKLSLEKKKQKENQKEL